MIARNKLSRLGRAHETKAPGASLADMINAAAARPAPPEASAATTTTTAVPKPRVVSAKAKPKPKPPECAPPRLPPAPPPPWHEEMLGWRSHGPRPPSSYEDGVRYETIHEYDPIEWAQKEWDCS
jgi:hypothetical protein